MIYHNHLYNLSIYSTSEYALQPYIQQRIAHSTPSYTSVTQLISPYCYTIAPINVNNIEQCKSAKEYYDAQKREEGFEQKKFRELQAQHDRLHEEYLREAEMSDRKKRIGKKYEPIVYRLTSGEHGKTCKCCTSPAKVEANERMREKKWAIIRSQRDGKSKPLLAVGAGNTDYDAVEWLVGGLTS